MTFELIDLSRVAYKCPWKRKKLRKKFVTESDKKKKIVFSKKKHCIEPKVKYPVQDF